MRSTTCVRHGKVSAEDALPVGESPLVMGQGVLEAPVGQAGVAQLLPGGHGLGMLGSLKALPDGQRAPAEPDRVRELACGPVRGGEVIVRAEGVGVVGPAGPLVIAGRGVQDRDRAARLARRG